MSSHQQLCKGERIGRFPGYKPGAGGGACYKPLNHPTQSVWLCDVTLFVLGKFPEKIFFRAGQ